MLLKIIYFYFLSKKKYFISLESKIKSISNFVQHFLETFIILIELFSLKHSFCQGIIDFYGVVLYNFKA